MMENQFGSQYGGSVPPSPSSSRSIQHMSIQRSQYDMTFDQLQNYDQYFQNVVQNGASMISGVQAKQLFLKTHQQRDNLSQVWQLTDIGSKGYLMKGEFIVAIHLISLLKKGVPLPQELSDNLLTVANGGDPSQQQNLNNSQVFQQPIQRLGSNQNIVPQRLGSNQSIQIPIRRLESNSSIGQVQQPIQPRLGSNSSIQMNNNLQGFSQGQPQMMSQQGQQVYIPINPNEISGWDPLQQQMNMARQQLGTVQSQANNTSIQLKDLFDRILIEKQQEVSYITQMTNSYRMLLQQLQEQYNFFQVELSKLESQKVNTKLTFQTVQQQVGQQQQLNNQVQQQYVNYQSQNQNPQQQNQQGLSPMSPGFVGQSFTNIPAQNHSWELNQQESYPNYNGVLQQLPQQQQQTNNSMLIQNPNQQGISNQLNISSQLGISNQSGSSIQNMDMTHDVNQVKQLQSVLKQTPTIQENGDNKKIVHFQMETSGNKNDVTMNQIEVDIGKQFQDEPWSQDDSNFGGNWQTNNFKNQQINQPKTNQNQNQQNQNTPNQNQFTNQSSGGQSQGQTQALNTKEQFPW